MNKFVPILNHGFAKLTRLVRRYPTWSGVSAVATALVLIGLSIIVALTMANNRELSRAIGIAKQESNRLEEMQRFFVKELKTASPSKDQGTERVETISQLLAHMLTGVESFRERDEVTYAKLLREISEICSDRSEFEAAKTGFERLAEFVSERPAKGH